MNDENDKPKNDDWGMTMPHMRYEEEKNNDGFSGESSPVSSRPPRQAASDEWGMTTPNLKVQNDYSSASDVSDFDKTEPNFNLPKDLWQDKAPPLDPLPADEWGMTTPNINLAPPENRADNWDTDAPNFNSPPSQANDWSMPSPVFRVSEGENIEDIKKTAAFKLSDLQGFDTDSMTFKTPAESSAGLFEKTAPSFNFQQTPPPMIPGSFAPAPTAPTAPEASAVVPPVTAAPVVPEPKKSSSKIPLVIGGLFTLLMFAGVFLAGVYFLFFNKPVETAVKSEPLTIKEANETSAPSAPLTAAPPTQTNNLPKQIDYKGAMMLVAAGEFTMGSDTGADESKPAHAVVLPAYYIDKTEVTNAEYQKFCDATGKSYPTNPHIEKDYFTARPNAPVVGVSFADAKAYADWAGKRLPTEEEWEKAASWDAAAQNKREFPWGNDFQKSRVAYQTSKISDVGKYASGASPSGALDMAGNVLEWVDSYFQPYPNSTGSNPEFGETNRVVRGGHFASKSPDSLKTTKRIYIPPTVASGEDGEKLVAAIIGFRCAVSADDSRVADVLAAQGK